MGCAIRNSGHKLHDMDHEDVPCDHVDSVIDCGASLGMRPVVLEVAYGTAQMEKHVE